MSLGIGRIRAISQSRGSKEGNDAFTKVGAPSLTWNIRIFYEFVDRTNNAVPFGIMRLAD